MTIRDERTGTDEILHDARFHRAALKADPRAGHLVERLAVAEGTLKERRAAQEAAHDARTEALALLLRADFELDERCRLVELEVLHAVGKNRGAEPYRAAFPRGLSDLVAMRGEEQARAVGALVGALKEQLPDLGGRHEAELMGLGEAATATERAWREAETRSSQAAAEERIARGELVRQMQKNEGALSELYPGQRRRVRSYFRPTRRRGAPPVPSGPEVAPTNG